MGYDRWKMKGDDKNHEIRFKQIERTVKYALDNDQRQIIELKYFGSEKVKDSYVYNELIMRRDSFYENKKIAIRLIATALGIIGTWFYFSEDEIMIFCVTDINCYMIRVIHLTRSALWQGFFI
ncbi:hypothetical protein [Bacillus cereus group sp. BfR-BA-01331]|nr:hypothetical protein [Bacillus cereus group sp. BfR-BA-01331]